MKHSKKLHGLLLVKIVYSVQINILRKEGNTLNRSKKIDMTQGSIMKLIILFALPMTLGNILQQLYSTVDTLVIGNFCGSESLAAVGTSAQPVEILLCVFIGLSTGASILVSQCIGSGDHLRLRQVVSTASSFLFICAIPTTVLGILLCPTLLRWMQVPEEAFHLSVFYTSIVFMATLGNLGYNINAGILRGMGDSKASLYFLIISCMVNVVLDLLFVAVFHMDVAGAALATAIAMYSSWFFSIIYIKRKYPELQYTVLPKSLDKGILRDIIVIGLPLGLNHSLYSVGHILMQALTNLQGYTYMAAWSVANKLTGIAGITITSFSSAATTFAGQNIGAEKYERLKSGGLRIPFFSGLFTCTFGIILTIFCRPLLRFFTPDQAVLDIAVTFIRVVLPFMWCYAVLNCIINFANGLGEVKYPTIINLLMLFAVRIPVAYAINYFGDGFYIMAAIPVSFWFGLTAMLFFYRSKRWKDIKQKTMS